MAIAADAAGARVRQGALIIAVASAAVLATSYLSVPGLRPERRSARLRSLPSAPLTAPDAGPDVEPVVSALAPPDALPRPEPDDRRDPLPTLERMLVDMANREEPSADATIEEETQFRDYIVRIWRWGGDDEQRQLEILQRGRRVFAECTRSAFVILREPCAEADVWPWRQEVRESCRPAWIGNDVTGDGEPDLVVVREDGGSFSPSLIRVFEIGERFRTVTTVEAYGWRFGHLDGDGVPELVAVEPCEYARQHTWAPRIVLRFQAGSYHPAPDLMRRPAAAFSDWRTVAGQLRAHEGWYSDADALLRPPKALCEYVVDLIYAGQADLAQDFLDCAWPESVPGKAEFVQGVARLVAPRECVIALYGPRSG